MGIHADHPEGPHLGVHVIACARDPHRLGLWGSLRLEDGIMKNKPNITISEDFVSDQHDLFRALVESIDWDQRMQARKTASFGVPYDYSGMTYEATPFPPWLEALATQVADQVGWQPNNGLLNYYPQRRSSMGMHADDVERLAPDTGIAIVSLGAPRMMVFERNDDSYMWGRDLPPGSLLVMDLDTQRTWRHAIPPRPLGPRISITLRQVRSDAAVDEAV